MLLLALATTIRVDKQELISVTDERFEARYQYNIDGKRMPATCITWSYSKDLEWQKAQQDKDKELPQGVVKYEGIKVANLKREIKEDRE